MPDSPIAGADGVLRVTVTSDGNALPGTAQLVSVTVRRALNAIGWARLELVDGDMPTGDFPLSDADLFKPGAAVSISAGYGEAEDPLFRGIVLRHSVSIAGGNRARLVVECRDKASLMTLRRHSANYPDKTDSDVMTALIQAAGLTADVAATGHSFPVLVQHHCSDWDFLVARAEANGMVVLAVDGTVKVAAPDGSAAAALTVTWGQDLLDFEASMDARTQAASAKAVAWDPKNQAVVESSDAAPGDLGSQGDLTGKALAEAVGAGALVLQTHTPQDKDVLDAWAKGAQTKAALARIRGALSFQGSAKAALGGLIEIKGVGRRFSGKVLVSGLRHEILGGGWTTRAEFGLDPSWQALRPGAEAPRAGGLLPSVAGLRTAVVLKLDADPLGEHRVQVQFPVDQADAPGVWARLAQFGASNGFGAFFAPEVGDEVVVGHCDGDPNHPVVLGALYSGARAPAYALEASNDLKALTTRSGHKLEFDEKGKKITLSTSAGDQVVLDASAKSVALQDQNGNSVKLSPDGIALDSASDIKLTAKGGITLDAASAVSVSSKADVKLAGLNVACEGQVGFSGKGSATAELSASGQTTVKGAMVMIN